MRQKVNTWITWTIEELDELVKQKNSCVFKETIQKHIPMYSIHLSDIKKSFQDILNSSINTFDPSFNGLLISYKNPTILQPLTQMFYDVQFVHVDLQADFYIFRPTVGSILTGIINKKEENYLGVLMHKTFNVSITKHPTIKSWPGHYLNVGDNATFRVTLVDLKAKVPFIRGELMSEGTTDNDERMDCIEEELNEEGGTELDSGYQESENEAKPSKSKAVPSFLTGGGSDSEDEERARKAKKKKIKNSEKTSKNQEIHEPPIQSPVKVSKKRKHDDDESPTKESKKVKRLKADELARKEVSNQSSVFTNDKPRIIDDEVLLSTNVNMKHENSEKKKSKKKKVAHDVSDSEEEQLSQPSRFDSQEKEEEEEKDDDDNDESPHDHSQWLRHKESPIPSSDDEPELPKTIVPANKSPQKNLEKKSKKKKAQDVMEREEDDDLLRDHSQSFAHARSQVSSSDDEPELPKMIVTANKSPQKKLENKAEKKSKKIKEQNIVKNNEDRSQSRRIDSQEDEEEEEEDDDLPRDHSQSFAHARSQVSSSDDEPELPKMVVTANKSLQKKLENRDEKKSMKKKTQDITKNRENQLQSQSQSSEVIRQEEEEEEDDDVPHDHSQSFAYAKSQVSSSDDESEVPEVQASVNKFPQKKLESKVEKKSKKIKMQNIITNNEDRLQTSRIGSQEEEEDDDLPRDHSQFIRDKSPTPSSDREPEVPKAKVAEPVAKEPKKKKQSEDLSPEELAKKKAEKKPRKKKETLSPEELTERMEIFRKHYDDVINEVIANSQNYKIDETVELTESELLALKPVDPEEQQSVVELKKEKKLKPKESKKAKPLGNSTVIEPQVDSADSSRIQEPSVSPVVPETKLKKSKSKKVVEPQELQSLDTTDKFEEGDFVVKKVKKSKKSKEKAPEVDSDSNSSIESAIPFSVIRVKQEPKPKKSKNNQSIEPKNVETTVVNGSLALLTESPKAQVPETSHEKIKKPKKSKKIVQEEKSTEQAPNNPMMTAIDKVLNVSKKKSIILGGFSDSDDDDSPDQPIVLSSVKVEKNTEDLANGVMKKPKKSKKSKDNDLGNRTFEELNSVDESVVIDTSRVKEEKKKKKKKAMETAVSNSVIESESNLLNSSEITVDTSIVKKESKKKKSKKMVDGIANPIGNSTINDSQLDSFAEADESTLNSSELHMSVIKIKQEPKGKKSKSKVVAEPSGNLTINESQLDSFREDSSRLQAVENSSEVRSKKSKSSEFVEPQVPSKSSLKSVADGSDLGTKKNKTKKSSFVGGIKIKEEPASDAEGSSKKSKHKGTDESVNPSKKIKQEMIVKQEGKKSGKRKRDDTINLSDVKFEAASDAEGPAAKKKINKLVFAE